MKTLEDVLLLGDERLNQESEPVKENENINEIISDLDSVLTKYQKKYKSGRAIAAPQLGYMKRIIYLKIDKPVVIINPEINNFSEEIFELWDDCISFPNLLVKVKRHKKCTLKFFDENFNEQIWTLEDDLSELLQHEYDHLNGILATQRAIDNKSFKMIR